MDRGNHYLVEIYYKTQTQIIILLSAKGLTMKDIEQRNIIFLSDENMPYAKEFTLLSDSEIADLIERRLYSNNYFDYTIYSIHKSKGTITLIRDACGHNVETSLSEIEDGLIPEECDECRQAKKDELVAFKEGIQDELNERGLAVILFETEENSDSLYIECTKCGAKYYLNDDFNLENEAWEMYCKNWNCMMDVLALENHWFATDIKSGKIVIKENKYKSDYSPFIMDSEDWVCNLDESDGSYEFKCDKCNAVNVLPFGKWECCACDLDLSGICTVVKWDEIDDKVTLNCKKCRNQYTISCVDAELGPYDCFECYKKQFDEEYTCPVCSKKYPMMPRKYFKCTSCGFGVARHIKNQAQYTDWIRKTVYPCSAVWKKMAHKYLKALNDQSASLKNEAKLLIETRRLIEEKAILLAENRKQNEEKNRLLTENRKQNEELRELNEELSQCYAKITEYRRSIYFLCKENMCNNTKISEMKVTPAILPALNQLQTETTINSSEESKKNK